MGCLGVMCGVQGQFWPAKTSSFSIRGCLKSWGIHKSPWVSILSHDLFMTTGWCNGGTPHDLWTLHMSCVQRHGVEPPRQQAAGCARKQWTAGSVVPRFINVSSLKNRSCFKSTHIYYNWSENFHCFCPSKAVIDAFHGNSMEHSCSSQIWQRNISHGSKIFPAINLHGSIEMMWVKQCHTPSPSHHHFYRWYNGNIYIHIHIVIYLFTHKKPFPGGLWHCFTHITSDFPWDFPIFFHQDLQCHRAAESQRPGARPRAKFLRMESYHGWNVYWMLKHMLNIIRTHTMYIYIYLYL